MNRSEIIHLQEQLAALRQREAKKKEKANG